MIFSRRDVLTVLGGGALSTACAAPQLPLPRRRTVVDEPAPPHPPFPNGIDPTDYQQTPPPHDFNDYLDGVAQWYRQNHHNTPELIRSVGNVSKYAIIAISNFYSGLPESATKELPYFMATSEFPKIVTDCNRALAFIENAGKMTTHAIAVAGEGLVRIYSLKKRNGSPFDHSRPFDIAQYSNTISTAGKPDKAFADFFGVMQEKGAYLRGDFATEIDQVKSKMRSFVYADADGDDISDLRRFSYKIVTLASRFRENVLVPFAKAAKPLPAMRIYQPIAQETPAPQRQQYRVPTAGQRATLGATQNGIQSGNALASMAILNRNLSF